MHYPTYLVFGLVLIGMGIIQFASRRWQGQYAHQQWKILGLQRAAKTPEYWAAASIPVSIIFVITGIALTAASFVP